LPGPKQERLAKPFVLRVLEDAFKKVAGDVRVLLGKRQSFLTS
jgi:hypothetical protein